MAKAAAVTCLIIAVVFVFFAFLNPRDPGWWYAIITLMLAQCAIGIWRIVCMMESYLHARKYANTPPSLRPMK